MLNFSKKCDNIIAFNNDQEFMDYCICPNVVILRGESGVLYYDINYTDLYNDAINSGTFFVIKDSNSQICKHNAVSLHSITKPISNLKQYNPRIHSDLE